jgi:hypothetical protein
VTKYTSDRSNFGADGPFFRIIREGLDGLADGEDYFDLLADDVVIEYVISVPGYPRRVEGRQAVIDLYSGYDDYMTVPSTRLSRPAPPRAPAPRPADDQGLCPASCHAPALPPWRCGGVSVLLATPEANSRLLRRARKSSAELPWPWAWTGRCSAEPYPRSPGRQRAQRRLPCLAVIMRSADGQPAGDPGAVLDVRCQVRAGRRPSSAA